MEDQDSLSRKPAAGTTVDEQPIQLDIQHWYRRVFALCKSKLISQSDSEDATQETFLRAVSKVHELRTHAALSGWLRQIARNVCVDMIRRQQVRRADGGCEIQLVCDDTKDDRLDQRETRDQLMQLVNALPENQREIVLLHYYGNMTYDDIPKWLGVACSTVNERLSKARHALRHELTRAEMQP